ncbi:serine/threonine-protein kinase Ste11p [Monosporozyma unispora]|nr:ATP binding [Kazachstania unispora]
MNTTVVPQVTATDLQFIEQFLTDINCFQYVSNFVQFHITEHDTLFHIDKDILTAIGVTKLGDRIRILRKIKMLTTKKQQDKEKLNMNELLDVINKFSQLGNTTSNNEGAMINRGNDVGMNLSHNSYDTSINGFNNTFGGSLASTEDFFTEKHHVIFILNDGSAKKVNVNGCFNANSIKKRLVKRLPKELQVSPSIKHPDSDNKDYNSISSDYDVFIVDYMKNVLHLLYDVELVTICHSNDRWERNRLIFVSRDQTPSDNAILTSKKIYMKTLFLMNRLQDSKKRQQLQNQKQQLQQRQIEQQQYGSPYHNNNNDIYDDDSENDDQISKQSSQLRIDNTKDKIRKVFNQRPPSEFITTNLSGYFPDANVKKLEKTLRDSYRQSIRLSAVGSGLQRVISAGSNNVGDILLKHSNDVDKALLQSLNQDNRPGNQSKVSFRNHDSDDVASNENADDDQYLDEGGYDDDMDADIVSLPTKMVTPKSWLKGARIGSGSFGSVYLGMNAQTGELMAVKQVAIQQPPTADNLSGSTPMKDDKEIMKQKNDSHIYRKMVESLQHEMVLLKELHHENIVTYYGSSEEGGNLNIFLEYVPGGSVSSMLNNYGPFEESLIINFTRQILIGVAYLHKKNIIHRDIKGANILIDIRGCVKITDFGISKKLSPLNSGNDDNHNDDGKDKQNKRASLQGSVYWMAPEVVKQTATTEKVDIWSTGCVVIEMFTGRHPYPDFSQMQAIFKIGTNKSPEIPSWASKEAKNFLRQTFELDYQRRPSAIELLQHSWLDTHLLA